uniref:non-specific serine/threonine protein kinase n=1 Tax=Manihot esculenta TaxID=3983 RepID=A0A2C9U3J2_MANES
MAFLNKPLFLLFLVLSSTHFVACLELADSEILVKFKGSLSNSSALDNWSEKTNPCTGDVSNWNGVICIKGFVRGLQLERMGLTGKIDVETLTGMSDLRTLSFMNNDLDGPMPELKKLRSLKVVSLSNNHFSGEIPTDAFKGMSKLKQLALSENEFTGAIPSSLATLPKLLELRLEGNKFTGNLPNFSISTFASFNVSNNELEGPIPATLSMMDSSSFFGNKDLCGQPLSQCNTNNASAAIATNFDRSTSKSISSTTSTSTYTSTYTSTSNSNSSGQSSSKKVSLASIIVVGIVMAVALAAIFAAAFILLKRRKQTSESIEAPPQSSIRKKTGFGGEDQIPQGSQSEQSAATGGKKAETTKLSFLRNDRERFDLSDLLKASAEVMGSGCFGSSYKAALSNGPVMVVKRFKQMNNVGKEEFHEHMRRLGRLRHPNLLPLVAFYYRKEEKLLITDYVDNGSLSIRLHGHQALGQPSMDWATRLKTVKGVANGLSYLYKELPSIITAHGHLKSSNILLNQSNEPLLTDYALVPVINQENAHELMVAYKSPEYLQLGRITKKTDVWSLGILILELLTGKFPPNILPPGKATEEEDLTSWAKAITEDQWQNQVIDKEISETKDSEGEMLKLLRIGISCCEGDVEKRLDLKEAVERINELKEKDTDENF